MCVPSQSPSGPSQGWINKALVMEPSEHVSSSHASCEERKIKHRDQTYTHRYTNAHMELVLHYLWSQQFSKEEHTSTEVSVLSRDWCSYHTYIHLPPYILHFIGVWMSNTVHAKKKVVRAYSSQQTLRYRHGLSN